MTAEFKSYLFSVIVACMITTIVKSIAVNSKSRKALELVCGLLIVLSLLRPLGGVNAEQLSTAIGKILSQTEDAERESRAYNARITSDIIKEKTETYIWDKAAEEAFVPTRVSVDMRFGETYPYAACVTIKGPYTDLQKKRIGDWIASALAIPEESQQWEWSKS